MGQAGDEAGSDRVGHAHEDDRDCGGRLPDRGGRLGPDGEDEVDRQADQLCRQLRELVDPAFGEASLQREVAALDVTEVAHASPQGLEVRRLQGRCPAGQVTETMDRRLPRRGRKQATATQQADAPKDQAALQELPPARALHDRPPHLTEPGSDQPHLTPWCVPPL